MRIDHLHVQNFKKFAEQDLELHAQFTLLAGENGAGKTTLLDALAVAASVWLVDPPDPILAGSRRNILPNEVRLESQQAGDRRQFRPIRPVVVEAAGQLAGNDHVTWTRQVREDGTRTTNADAKAALALIQQWYTTDANGTPLTCPVLAYYGAGRAWLPSNERSSKADANGPARRWAAFYDCFNERIRISDLINWFKREAIERGNRGGRWRPGFEVVAKAILGCIPGADNVTYDSDLDDIVLFIEGVAQPFDNLSAGQRAMLAMVANLAVKCVTQNAYLLPPDELGPDDTPAPRVLRETPGIVLIDELDVHLHPIWQRRIANDLKQTFPTIQFVCTSHSPQIIGELHPDEIRLMHGDEITQPAMSFGMDSNWVVEMIMGGSKCNAEVKGRLGRVFQLIKDKKLAEAETEALLLRGDVGNSDDIQRAVSMIERIKFLGK